MRKVQLHHPREWMIGMHFLSLFLADISRSKSRGMKLRGLDQAFGTPYRGVVTSYCNCYNYRRNGNVAVPGLFIYSGGKQGGNYLEWRSRKKNQASCLFFFAIFFLQT